MKNEFSCAEIIAELKARASPKNVEGMARFGISAKNTLGVPIPILRGLAKKIGKNNGLSLRLWDTQIHEARLLAGFIAEPEKATEKQLEKWVAGFDSWDVCDQVCSSFFDKTQFAWEKAFEWTSRKEEFVKRAGFTMMACLAVHDKKAGNTDFEKFFPLIKKHCADERNFVKKAVNWALRQIGKRNEKLRKKAVAVAREIAGSDSKSARWIASNALSELESPAVKERVKKKQEEKKNKKKGRKKKLFAQELPRVPFGIVVRRNVTAVCFF